MISAAFLVCAPVEIIMVIRIQMIKIRYADDQTQQGYAERDQETREEGGRRVREREIKNRLSMTHVEIGEGDPPQLL